MDDGPNYWMGLVLFGGMAALAYGPDYFERKREAEWRLKALEVLAQYMELDLEKRAAFRKRHDRNYKWWRRKRFFRARKLERLYANNWHAGRHWQNRWLFSVPVRLALGFDCKNWSRTDTMLVYPTPWHRFSRRLAEQEKIQAVLDSEDRRVQRLTMNQLFSEETGFRFAHLENTAVD